MALLYISSAKFCDWVPGRCSRSCGCLSCITLEQASQSELSCLNIDKDSYVSLEKCKEPPIRYRYFFDSTPLPQESPILQPEMVSRSCRSETLKGTCRLPNHWSQNQDKNCTEDQDYWMCLNHTGVKFLIIYHTIIVANQKLISNFFQRHHERHFVMAA